MYYRYYKEHIYKWAQTISNVAIFTYAIENISLVTLSFWTSDENYGMYIDILRCYKYKVMYISLTAFHKLSFIMFLIMSFIHMLVAYFIMKNCRNITRELSESVSMKWKWRSLVLNVLSIMFACYFFYRHNKYCEPLGELDINEKKEDETN